MIDQSEIKRILEDEKLKSSEKLEKLALFLPVCQQMQQMKKKFFWKLVLEDVCILLLRENFDLKQQAADQNTVRVPFVGVAR